MRKKSESKAPEATEVAPVEAQALLVTEETDPTTPMESRPVSKFERQTGVTQEELNTSEYNPKVQLKIMFADIMETMHNYQMSQEGQNQSRYNDIMNHILTSCQLVDTFVK